MMSQNRTNLAVLRLILAVIGFTGLLGQISVFEAKSLSLIDLFSYFTIQSNILVIITLLSLASFAFFRKDLEKLSMYRGAATLYIVMTGIIYFFVLRGTNSQATVPWVNVIMHYLMPVAMLADWIAFNPRMIISYKKATLWMIYPLLYTVYSLTRGHFVGWYPYLFLNPVAIGYFYVFSTICLISLAFLVLIYLLALVIKLKQTSIMA